MCPSHTRYLPAWLVPSRDGGVVMISIDFDTCWPKKDVGQPWENISAEAHVCCEWESTWWLVTEEYKSFCFKGKKSWKCQTELFLKKSSLMKFLTATAIPQILHQNTSWNAVHELQQSRDKYRLKKTLCFLRNKITWRK